jgi:hypothetical protein
MPGRSALSLAGGRRVASRSPGRSGARIHRVAQEPTYWARRTNLVAETIDDETMVVDWEAGVFYRFVGTSAVFWSRLWDGVTIPALVSELAATYGADAADGAGPFLAELVAEGLVVTDPPHRDAPGDGGSVPWPGAFTPLAFHKHADMADLLLVDPIHDVDVEEGWPERREP